MTELMTPEDLSVFTEGNACRSLSRQAIIRIMYF